MTPSQRKPPQKPQKKKGHWTLPAGLALAIALLVFVIVRRQPNGGTPADDAPQVTSDSHRKPASIHLSPLMAGKPSALLPAPPAPPTAGTPPSGKKPDLFDLAPVLARMESPPDAEGRIRVVSIIKPENWPEVRKVEWYYSKSLLNSSERISRQLMTANLIVVAPHTDADLSSLRKAAESVGATLKQPHDFAPIFEVEFNGSDPAKMDTVLERFKKERGQLASMGPDYIVKIKY